MDSFKRLFRPVANAADSTPIAAKKNPFNIDKEETDDNIHTPNINIQRHKIPTKIFSFKMQDDPLTFNKNEDDFNIQSGAILSSSSNYSFVSSDGLDERRKPEETHKPPIGIEKVEAVKPKPRLYASSFSKTKVALTKENSGFETRSEPEAVDKRDVLTQLKSLFYLYENLIVDLDTRLEFMHESLLCDFINRDD